jgi:hypothetical protein
LLPKDGWVECDTAGWEFRWCSRFNWSWWIPSLTVKETFMWLVCAHGRRLIAKRIKATKSITQTTKECWRWSHIVIKVCNLIITC